MKTSILALAFSFMFMLPNYSEAHLKPSVSDTLKTTTGGDEEVDLTVDENLLFQDRVYIHIYDQSEKPIISGSFSRKDLNENKTLKSLLRKSTRFLHIDQHYYYYVNEG